MAPQAQTKELSAPHAATVPRHVAIIMDGNGRWAKQRGLPRLAGHKAGTEILNRTVRAFRDRRVRYVTLYTFSTENWGRPKREISGLWRLLAQVLRREVKELHAQGVRLNHIGRLDRLNPKLRRTIEEALELTKDNTAITLSVALDYGGRSELVEAVRRIVQSGVDAEDIRGETISSALYTAGLPDPDLVIRTAGEMRLSNFLIWQTAYSEYYATDACWPDFDEAEIDRALQVYSNRQRRFGGLSPQP